MSTIAQDRLLRRPEVERITGFSTPPIYRLMKLGRFPLPVRLGERTVRWSSNELDEWLSDRPRGVDSGSA